MFHLIYSPENKVEAVEKSGAKLPFNPAAKTFDEAHPLVVELRKWESENNIDLVAWGNRDRSAPEAPPKGDRVVETDATGVVEKEWSYNGSSYVSLPMRSSFNYVNLAASISIILSVDKSYDLLLSNLQIDYAVTGRIGAKYWKFDLYRVSKNANKILLKTQNTSSGDANSLMTPLNLEDKIGTNNTLYYQLEVSPSLGSGTLSCSGDLIYKHQKQ